MPELPEVQTIATDLAEALTGTVIEKAILNFPKIVATDPEAFESFLVGTRIEGVDRLGKFIHFHLNNDRHLLTHLKMTGRFSLGEWPLDGIWPKHAHIAFRLQDRAPPLDTLFYCDTRKFGRLRAFHGNDLAAYVQKIFLGPDPLLIDAKDFHDRITAKRGRLKAVLLNQSVVSGLGNIYADESLFAAGFHPARSAASLSRTETAHLLIHIQKLLRDAIARRGSTTSTYEGLKGGGSFQNQHRVYGRSGQNCLVCHQPLARAIIAGRGTSYCPTCQRL